MLSHLIYKAIHFNDLQVGKGEDQMLEMAPKADSTMIRRPLVGSHKEQTPHLLNLVLNTMC